MRLKRKKQSSTVFHRLKGIKNPTKAEKAKWKWLVDILIEMVLSNGRRHDIGAGILHLDAKLPLDWQRPDGWPKPFNKKVLPTHIECTFNAEKVLGWLYERKLSDYSAHMLYRDRGRMMSSNRKNKIINMIIGDAPFREAIEIDDKFLAIDKNQGYDVSTVEIDEEEE